MKPDRNSPWRACGMSSVLKSFCTTIVFGALLFTSTLSAQTSVGTTTPKSDPTVLAVISKALSALGGAGSWQSIGAFTAKVSVSRPVGPVETVQLSNDWHLGYLLARGDCSDTKGRTATVITQQNQQIRTVGSSATKSIPRENDMAVLSKVNPGAALALSLSQSNCIFKPANAVDTLGITGETIEEDCNDPFLPVVARLMWTFSESTGLPTQVKIPIRDALHNAVAYETVRYTQFSSQGKVIVPSEVNIALPSGQTEQRLISQWSFSTSLPSSTFPTTN